MYKLEDIINKVHQADCLEFMKQMPDKCVDMILCDLPYGTTACSWDTIIPFEPLWEQYKRIIKDNGAIVLTASQPFTSALVMSNMEWFRYEMIWSKNRGTGIFNAKKIPMKSHENILVFYLDKAEISGRSKEFLKLRDYFNEELKKSGLTSKQVKSLLGNDMGGHYFTKGIQWTLPTSENYQKLQTTGFFKRDYGELKKEFNLISEKCLNTYNPQMIKGKPYTAKQGKQSDGFGLKTGKEITTENNGERYPLTVLNFNSENGRNIHPTQKPVALFEYLIKTYTNEGDIVLDNCAGSGTTGIASINTKRNYILIEKDEHYCEVARNRIEEYLYRLNKKLL